MNLFREKVICPFCGYTNQVAFPQYGAGCPQIIHCDTDEGGCDQFFAVTAKVTVLVEPTVHRLEGIGHTIDRVAAEADDGDCF